MSKELTEKQEIFCEVFPQTGDIEEAAEEAGYADTTPAHVKQDVLSSEAVRDKLMEQMIIENFAGKLKLSDLAETALDALEEILEDSEIPPRVKLQAIDSTLDRNEELKKVLGIELSGKVTEKRENEISVDLEKLDENERNQFIERLSRTISDG